jgi:hypothetical protein
MPLHRPLVVALVLIATACSSETPTSPTTSDTATVAPAAISETYNGTLPVGGLRFYSFTVVQNGIVNLTLTSLGQAIAADVAVELTLGQPSGTGCVSRTSVTVTVETAAPHLTGTFAPGVYCARVADTGNLPSTASFVVAIEHS